MKLHNKFCAGITCATISATPFFGQENEKVFDLDPVLVTANPFAAEKEDLIRPADHMSNDALQREMGGTLGDTLANTPGVQTTWFGPGAGRPVIRGFDGDRVRILHDGTDSFDLSQTSPDHAVGIEPMLAQSIEVVRGPASLLYGNAAIGGVVNVVGREMPRFAPQEPFSGQIETRYGTGSDALGVGGTFLGGTEKFAWSAGYIKRDANDTDIPGFAYSRYATPNEAGPEDVSGTLSNTALQSKSGYVGGTRFFDSGQASLAYTGFASLYGVPSQEEEPIRIDLRQHGVSGRLELNDPTPFWKNVEAQFGYGTYRHAELEGDEVGTVFTREGTELRLTGVHQPIGDFTGAWGLHAKREDFGAEGEEAFIPSNKLTNLAAYAVERRSFEWGVWEIGGRIEQQRITLSDTNDDSQKSTVNLSTGFTHRIAEGTSLSADITYAQRAPNATELFSFGPHPGTGVFEIGNAALGLESSVNAELTARRDIGRLTGSVTAYLSDFSDYVFLQKLSDEAATELYGDLDAGDLGIYRHVADDARFYGYEFETVFHFIDEADRKLHLRLTSDTTRAVNVSEDTNLPRIPTQRFGGRLEWISGPWLLGLEESHVSSATHLAPDELPTDAFDKVGLDARFRWEQDNGHIVNLYAKLANATNEEGRLHTSFLKDIAPLPGRSLTLGMDYSF